MSSDSGQKFIKRNRPPRVQISYEDPTNAEKLVVLPFVMGVMSDLSGNASQVEKAPMAERKFTDVDMDNLDAYMASIKPAVSMRVKNKLGTDSESESIGVDLTFNKMADFEPAAIVRKVPALKALLEAREQLSNLQRYMDGKVAAEDKLRELLTNPERLRAMSQLRRDPAKTDQEPSDANPTSDDNQG